MQTGHFNRLRKQVLILGILSFSGTALQAELNSQSCFIDPDRSTQQSLNDQHTIAKYKIAVIGTGYVGLVLGVCLADVGHTVTCCDIDKNKIDLLNQGHLLIYEEGLEEMASSTRAQNRLFFSNDLVKTVREHDIIFIAVGTPSQKNGEADVSAVRQVAQLIGENLNSYKTIIVKSTVPIGMNSSIRSIISEYNQSSNDFDIAYSPEFLREGTSIKDLCEPDRVLLGFQKEETKQLFCKIFEPLYRENIPFLFTDITSAEVSKYASNSFLAVKLSFINEIADICEATGADISAVAKGMGLDKRIGPFFLNPGPGFGGSCLPKDSAAFLYQAEKLNVELRVLNAAVAVNKERPLRVIQKLSQLMEQPLKDTTIALLGLSFKENTDDVRESPAIKIIEKLLLEGVSIQVYDPMAMDNMKKIYPNIHYCSSVEHAVKSADAVILLTPWEQFKNIDLLKLRSLVKYPVFLDLRNCINPNELSGHGFKYAIIGRSS